METDLKWVAVEVNSKKNRVFAFRFEGTGKPKKRQEAERFILSKKQTLDLIRRLGDCAASHGWIEVSDA
jgi:hypothetical protein